MKLTEIALKYPVAAWLTTITLLILGFYSIPRIPVSFWPEFVAPTLIIMAPYPGVGPEEVEEAIAKPLEEELSTLDGLDEIETTCSDGLCRISARFDWGMDFDETKLAVQECANKARSRFPREAPEPKVIQIQDFLAPGIEFSFTSSRRSPGEVRDFVDSKLKNRFLRLKNVATANIFGGRENHIAVKVNPDKLYLYGITFQQIAARIASENGNTAAGKIESDYNQQYIRAIGKFEEVQELEQIIIASPGGKPLYLKDIARVRFESKEQTTLTRLNGRNIIGLAIREKSGGNTVAMCAEARTLLADIRKTMPEDIQVEIIRDQSVFIQQSINSVLNNALLGSVLASIVLLFFLGSIRNTLIIAVSIPVSVISTFILINSFGLSINTISLGGLALGVGMIVDAAIVVLENIYRTMREKPGQDRRQLVTEAGGEVGLAITSSTLTSIVVFLPMAFLVGLAAVLLGELALTVVFSLSISILVALTIVPLLSFRLMRIERMNRASLVLQNSFDRLLEQYKKSLRFALQRRLLMLGIVVALLIAAIKFIAPALDVELLPAINEGEFSIDLEMPSGTRLEITRQMVERLEQKLLSDARIEKVYGIVGQTARINEIRSNMAYMTVRIKQEQRQRIALIMQDCRRFCTTLPGARTIVQQVSATQGMSREPVNVRINGSDLKLLREIGETAYRSLSKTPGIVNIRSASAQGLPEFHLKVDRFKAAELGLSNTEISSALRFAVLGSSVSRFSAAGNEYDITLKADSACVQDIGDVMNLPLRAASGLVIPLCNVARAELENSPSEIKRFDQVRVVEIKADVAGRASREVNAEVKAIMEKMPLPPDYYITYGGMSRSIRDSFSSLGNALLIAIFLVYVVMGAQFNSFIHPFTIAATIPLALIGVLLGLWIFDAAISTNAILGSIMLIGIVVNNGILLIDFIEQLRKRGTEKMDAIVEASALRVRPILITSLTTIFGMLPIALGLGEGGEALKPLGAVVLGGLTTSTFLTLFIIPVVYSLMDRQKRF
jgi:HAE1 family hydrophobic/amphiphilic exporter-1